MIDTFKLFSIGNFVGDNIKDGKSLVAMKTRRFISQIPADTCVFVHKKICEKGSKDRFVIFYSIFPNRINQSCFNTHESNILDLKHMERNWLAMHKIRSIPRFVNRYYRTGALSSHVKEKGPITFIFDNNRTAEKFTWDLPSTILSKYNHNSVIHANCVNRDTKSKHTDFEGEDKYKLAVTFIDVKDIMPIYKPNKVDGMCVYIQTFLNLDYSKLNNLVRGTSIFILLSNYRDNVLYLDGEHINKKTPLDPGYIERISKELSRKAKKSKKKRLKVKTDKSSGESETTTINVPYYSDGGSSEPYYNYNTTIT